MNRAVETYDLTNCDREPIHIPGNIQSYGLLLGCRPETLEITYASENCAEHLGIAAPELLGTGVLDLIAADQRPLARACLTPSGEERRDPDKITLDTRRGPRTFDVLAHRAGDVVILEFEVDPTDAAAARSSYQSLRTIVAGLKASATLEELYGNCAAHVRRLTGFDRVNIYRFDAAWNGHVLAEEKGERGDSYLGLHFPASDIPKQARDLYQRNPIRTIADVAAPPARLVTRDQPALDLSLATLRGVSPIHLEYLRNMEVTASMSISLHKDGRLWGLVSCTHLSGPRRISFATRALCELIGEIMSSLLSLRSGAGHESDWDRKAVVQGKLLESMSKSDDFAGGLLADPDLFLELTGAIGGAVYADGDFRVVGRAPDSAQLKKIVAWLAEQSFDGVLSSDQLPIDWPAGGEMRDVASGLLAVSISKAKATYVLWFRPEVIQTVTWGGNPQKVREGPAALHPRKSFEAWKQIVRDHSLPWRRSELEAARRLRAAIMDIVLHKLEKISLLNRELQRSNAELDSFAYAASHDLKEPLRGIHNYAMILSRALEGRIDVAEKGRFATIGRLSQRMEELINSLLNFAQVGRAEMAFARNDLNEIVRAALESLQTRIDDEHVDIVCGFDMPAIVCDRVQVIEIFTNLINNAIKYNDQERKRVQIDAHHDTHGDLVLSVADNGIGIEPDHHGSIFKIFKRLHAKDQYGGGTGTGLTITAKIVERHGGRIWVASDAAGGARFSFTLPGPAHG